MNPKDQLLSSRENILRLAQEHGASNVRVFGSIARGDFTESSDIDLLIDMLPGKSLLNLIGFKLSLEALLERRVDVVTSTGLKPRIRENVFRECVPL